MPRKKVAHTDTLNWRAEVYQSGGKPTKEDIKSYPSAKQMDKMYGLLWASPNQGASIVDAILGSRPSGRPYKAAWTVPCKAKKSLKSVLPNAVALSVYHEVNSANGEDPDGELYELETDKYCPTSLKEIAEKVLSMLQTGGVDNWKIRGEKDKLEITLYEQDPMVEEWQAFERELEEDFEAWENGGDYILDWDNNWFGYAAGEGITESELSDGLARELGYSFDSKSDVGSVYEHTVIITGAIDPAFVGNIKPRYDFSLSFLKMAIVWGWEKPFELSREAGR